MKIAIVHDYLYQFGGAEKCVEKWLEMYPNADVYTSFVVPQKFVNSKVITQAYKNKQIKTTILQKLFEIPFFLKFQKHLFFIYPLVFSFWKVKNYDKVILSSTFCAKNIQFENCSKILFYCYTPTRFLHNLLTEEDHQNINWFFRKTMKIFTFFLKKLDLRAVNNLNRLGAKWISISEFVQKNILEIYKTDSEVIYPPVEIDNFLAIKREKTETLEQNPYLYFGRISFHKRLDLVILACLELGRKLKIAGGASLYSEFKALQKIVTDFELKNPEKKSLIEFLGRVSDEQRDQLLQTSRAFLFPTKEDFGIVSIEAFAAGMPIVAYQDGGALEYVKPNQNGIFFEKQTVESLKQGILEFEAQKDWNTEIIKSTSRDFSAQKFVLEIKKALEI